MTVSFQGMNDPYVVDTIELTQDIGSHEPEYKTVVVELMSDRSMRWVEVK